MNRRRNDNTSCQEPREILAIQARFQYGAFDAVLSIRGILTKRYVNAESRSGLRQEPLVKLVRPFQRFAGREAAGGILLLACSIAALVWANSPWAGTYSGLWHTPLTVGFGVFTLSHDLHFWVNDGLMTVFFFVVGLEIKRELLAGELASPRQAVLPFVAAMGGVAVPALLYFAINSGGPGAAGWGIAMATDIAFAIGVMALLGARVPSVSRCS